MTTGYYLLDHPNPHGPHYYPSRRSPLLAVVIHITAGLQDLDGVDDQSAERTAAYAASTDRPVSWHLGADSDSWLSLLPATYTAFQCQGYNSSTLGIEISKADTTWTGEPTQWVERTLANAAAALQQVLRTFDIPVRHSTRAELDAAIATGSGPVGLIGHAELDPTRRSDPGSDFPWAWFLALLTDQTEDVMTPEQALQLKETRALAEDARNKAGWALDNAAALVKEHREFAKEVREFMARPTPQPAPATSGGLTQADRDAIAEAVATKLAARLQS